MGGAYIDRKGIMTPATKPLTVFHIDLNFIALREDYLRHWLRQLADMGYNAILWELENKVQWETCPECVDPEALSKERFRAILDDARALGLEPIPLLQTIGHGEYVMLHEPYVSLRENPERHDCYCTSNPQARQFLRRWISEYVELFGDIRFFHLGGDEAYEFGTCPICREVIKRDGHHKLYADHLLDIATPLTERGIRLCVWADMVLAHPAELANVSRDIVLWDWNYAASDLNNPQVRVWGDAYYTPETIPAATRAAFPQLFFADGKINPFYTVDFLLDNGYEVVLCSAARSGGSPVHCGRHQRHAENVAGCARKAAQAGLTGTCVTSWGIRQYSYETQAQWLLLAPMLMQDPTLPYAQLLEMVGRQLFGCDPTQFYQAITLIGAPFLFDLTGDLGFQWNRLKDQLPAPAGFMANQIAILKKDRRWGDAPQRQLAETGAGLIQGCWLLQETALQATRGFRVLNAWLDAARLQLLQMQLAQGLLATAEGEAVDNVAYAELAAELRESFRKNAEIGQCPGSAARNAGLLYTPSLDYFDTRN